MRLWILIFLFLIVNATIAAPLPYPIKPIRLVSPYPPGGFNDILSRLVGQKLSEKWAHPVVIDNRPGANMIVGTNVVAKSPADGYTLLMSAVPHVINPALYKLPFDPIKDFTPIIDIVSVPSLLVVHPSVPVSSVRELINFAKSNPDKLTFASVGSGSSMHLAGEMFKLMAGINMVHVPYKGAAPAITDLIAGRSLVYFGNIVSVMPQVKNNRLRALATTELKRSSAAPELPTIAESGVPNYSAGSWYGLMGPAGMEKNIINKINHEVIELTKMADVKERFLKDGAETVASTPQEFLETIKIDIEKWGKVVAATGARVD
jgi:tripartite-type tricarboxylate transporter receptor subunit TctC